jgi:hypothetical protein
MKDSAKLKVLFIAGFGPIVRDTGESRKLYCDALGIPFKEEPDGYLHTEAVPGAKSFALWPLSQVAQSCFGKDSWRKEIPAPQAWLEFDVESVEKATEILKSRGYRMLVKNKKKNRGDKLSAVSFRRKEYWRVLPLLHCCGNRSRHPILKIGPRRNRVPSGHPEVILRPSARARSCLGELRQPFPMQIGNE